MVSTPPINPKSPCSKINTNTTKCWWKKTSRFIPTANTTLYPSSAKAHVAYIGKDKVIGLSKLNRIVQHFAKRPQVQERMTMQIAEELKQVPCKPKTLAVIIEAKHLCVSSRGVNDDTSSTITSFYGGKFLNENRPNRSFLNIYHSCLLKYFLSC